MVYYEDDEVQFVKSYPENTIGEIIVQHIIPKKPNKILMSIQEPLSKLVSLSVELLLKITTDFEVEDVENLGKTCIDLNIKINSLFITRLVLPLSQSNFKKLGGRSGRFILSLTSSLNVRIWNQIA